MKNPLRTHLAEAKRFFTNTPTPLSNIRYIAGDSWRSASATDLVFSSSDEPNTGFLEFGARKQRAGWEVFHTEGTRGAGTTGRAVYGAGLAPEVAVDLLIRVCNQKRAEVEAVRRAPQDLRQKLEAATAMEPPAVLSAISELFAASARLVNPVVHVETRPMFAGRTQPYVRDVVKRMAAGETFGTKPAAAPVSASQPRA